MYNYIIVGAGSAGCVLANRLTEDPDLRVLLLEAGPPDTLDAIHTPERFQETWFADCTSQYLTEEEPYLWSDQLAPKQGRRVFYPQGKTLGGGSSINVMMYIRGNRRDYDCWNYLGNDGWSYQEVLPYFRKSEDQQRGANQYHGVGGPMAVSDLNPPNPISLAFVEGAEQLGHPKNEDFNGARQEGVGLYQVNVRDGKRESTATAFLHPIEKERQNLTVLTGARTRRILFEGTRAIGVEYDLQRDSFAETIRVGAENEVIVSGGAVNSPKLLLLSGIGPADHLRSFGIPVVADLPGVGQNLQDHAVIGTGNLYKEGKKVSPLYAGSGEGGLFVRTRPGLEAASPDLQYVFTVWLFIPPDYVSPSPPVQVGFSVASVLVKPQSVGSISLRSANITDPPVIQVNFLNCEADLRALVWGVKHAREIVRARTFDDWRGDEIAPGPNVTGDEQLRRYIRLGCSGLFHPVGTCKMGNDKMAVVNPQLLVHGVEGLRVIDSSIMPIITAGNTNAPTIMIAEKAADIIKAAFR
jgi:choline dehydrogenase